MPLWSCRLIGKISFCQPSWCFNNFAAALHSEAKGQEEACGACQWLCLWATTGPSWLTALGLLLTALHVRIDPASLDSKEEIPWI